MKSGRHHDLRHCSWEGEEGVEGTPRFGPQRGLDDAHLTLNFSTPVSALPGPEPSWVPTLGLLGQQLPAPTLPCPCSPPLSFYAHSKFLSLPCPIRSWPNTPSPGVCFFWTKYMLPLLSPQLSYPPLFSKHSWAASLGQALVGVPLNSQVFNASLQLIKVGVAPFHRGGN